MIGYSIPVCLWEKDGEPNLEEKAFFEVINKITEICQFHLEEEFGADLASTLNAPFYYKQVEYVHKKGKKKTKRDEAAAPVLYGKLIYSEKSKKIISLFSTKGKEKVNPFDFLEQYCRVKMALIIERVFIKLIHLFKSECMRFLLNHSNQEKHHFQSKKVMMKKVMRKKKLTQK